MQSPIPIAALTSLLAWASISHAASFDCAKATQPAERLICSDSALSSLDEAMAAEYSRARAAVSENGRKQLRDNQRSWLKYTAGTCAKPATALQCMRDAYQERLTAAGYGGITTEIEPLGEFFYAEAYHQQYLYKVPNGYCPVHSTGVSCPVGLPGV